MKNLILKILFKLFPIWTQKTVYSGCLKENKKKRPFDNLTNPVLSSIETDLVIESLGLEPLDLDYSEETK